MNSNVAYYFWFVAIVLSGDITHMMVKHSILTLAVETSPEKFPFHAAINSKFVCNGILISDQYIICPAHCVNDSTWGTKVFLGTSADAYFHSRNLQKGAEIRRSQELIIHEKYIRTSRNVYLNNIALLKLSEKIPFSRHIQPGILMSKKEYQLVGETLVNVTGWYTDIIYNLSVSTEQLLNRDTCRYIYGPYFFPSQELCLQWKGNENRLNLSGNIISIKGKILGFITRSPCHPEKFKCADYHKVLVIAPFLDWISRQTNIDIDKLTGTRSDQLEMSEKLSNLGYLALEIRAQSLEHKDRLEQLETSLHEVYELLKGINSTTEDSCLVWNDEIELE